MPFTGKAGFTMMYAAHDAFTRDCSAWRPHANAATLRRRHRWLGDVLEQPETIKQSHWNRQRTGAMLPVIPQAPAAFSITKDIAFEYAEVVDE